MNTVFIDHMSWPEYQQQVDADLPVILPVGALEQHGPHLPMATDALFAERMAQAVAESLPAMVLPALRYGYKSQARSGGGQTFPGTTSLDGSTLMHTVMDIIRELQRHGVKRCIVLNGHVENQWFLTEGIELIQRELRLLGQTMQIVRAEYWDFTPHEVYDQVFDGPFPGVDLEHAALLETSMMLYWYPEKVRQELIPNDPLADFPPFDRYPQNGDRVPASGVLAPAAGASAEKGRIIIEATVAAMVEEFRSCFR